jgi:hypothetical protein
LALPFALTLAAPVTARAGAAHYGLTFGGVINTVAPRIDDGTFEVGAEVTGFLRIDASVSDNRPSPDEAFYDGAVSDRFVSLGDYEATAPSGDLLIRDAAGAPNADEFYVDGDVTGPPVAGLAPGNLILFMIDPTLEAFASDAIPTSLDFADFSARSLQLFFPEGNESNPVDVTLTSLSYVSVPEPGGGVLTAAGALALMALRGSVRGSRARPAP